MVDDKTPNASVDNSRPLATRQGGTRNANQTEQASKNDSEWEMTVEERKA